MAGKRLLEETGNIQAGCYKISAGFYCDFSVYGGTQRTSRWALELSWPLLSWGNWTVTSSFCPVGFLPQMGCPTVKGSFTPPLASRKLCFYCFLNYNHSTGCALVSTCPLSFWIHLTFVFERGRLCWGGGINCIQRSGDAFRCKLRFLALDSSCFSASMPAALYSLVVICCSVQLICSRTVFTWMLLSQIFSRLFKVSYPGKLKKRNLA